MQSRLQPDRRAVFTHRPRRATVRSMGKHTTPPRDNPTGGNNPPGNGDGVPTTVTQPGTGSHRDNNGKGGGSGGGNRK